MNKIKHSWEKLFGTGKMNHAECRKCKLQKWYDIIRERTVYLTLNGETLYWAPECIPN